MRAMPVPEVRSEPRPTAGRSIATAAALGVTALLIAAAALAALAGPAAALPAVGPAAQVRSTCVARTTKVAGPPVVGVGGTADLTLTMSFSGCPGGYDGALHVVLVLDGSGSMAGESNRLIRKAGRGLIDRLALTNNPAIRVGVVTFNGAAKVLCELTSTAAQASSCVGRVGAAGGGCMDCGIKAARGVLARGRSIAADPNHVREVMVVISDYYNLDLAACTPMVAPAREMKAQGIEVFTLCVSRTACDTTCLPMVATSPPYHFFAKGGDLSTALDRIRAELDVRPLPHMVVTDTLGAGMSLDNGRVSAPGLPSPDGRAVVWRLADVPTLATELRLAVRVGTAVGIHPTNASAVGTFVDALGARGAFTFPLPTIRVEPGTPVPTPAATATPRGFRPSPTPPPSPVPPDPGEPGLCPRLTARLPRAAIDAALADPARVGGWGVPCRAGQPVGPMNPLRHWLDLRNVNLPWHPVFNGVVFKCGCG